MRLNLEIQMYTIYLFIFKDFIYLFSERGVAKEKEKERNINVWLPFTCPLLWTWPATQACALTGNRAATPWFADLRSIH